MKPAQCEFIAKCSRPPTDRERDKHSHILAILLLSFRRSRFGVNNKLEYVYAPLIMHSVKLIGYFAPTGTLPLRLDLAARRWAGGVESHHDHVCAHVSATDARRQSSTSGRQQLTHHVPSYAHSSANKSAAGGLLHDFHTWPCVGVGVCVCLCVRSRR